MSPKKNDAAKKKKPAEKEAWKSDSLDGALLFLLFHKRLVHPDDFNPAELQQHPNSPFRKYSGQTFKRNCQTIANRTTEFEEKGTGLTDAFKKCIGAVLEDKPELFGKETRKTQNLWTRSCSATTSKISASIQAPQHSLLL